MHNGLFQINPLCIGFRSSCWLLWCRIVQYSTVQYCAVKYITVQYSEVLCPDGRNFGILVRIRNVVKITYSGVSQYSRYCEVLFPYGENFVFKCEYKFVMKEIIRFSFQTSVDTFVLHSSTPSVSSDTRTVPGVGQSEEPSGGDNCLAVMFHFPMSIWQGDISVIYCTGQYSSADMGNCIDTYFSVLGHFW